MLHEIMMRLRPLGAHVGYELPDRLALLITNPRSGSTWLLDTLRAHPDIEMSPSGAVFSHLRLRGRRYPRDLSSMQDATFEIETTPGKHVRIPSFSVDLATRPVSLPHFAIEKIHPQFYAFNARRFARRLEAFRATHELRPVYEVRDPKSSMLSFLAYQSRRSAWNDHIRPRHLPRYMRRIFQSIDELATAVPGAIVDYTEIFDDPETVIRRILRYLWGPDADVSSNVGNLAASMLRATGRGLRRKNDSPFLGKQTSEEIMESSWPFTDFSPDDPDFQACAEIYERLHGQAKRQRDSDEGN